MRRVWFHALLFVATLASTCAVFFFSWDGGGSGPTSERVFNSVLFACCALLILGSHEAGHYLLARHHQVETSLPYFIPVPFGFGTMGAVIRLKGRIPTRDALVDIGAAGPLAGLAVALPLLVAGTWLSRVETFPVALSTALPAKTSLLSLLHLAWAALQEWRTGVPSVVEPLLGFQVFGDNVLTLVVQRLVKGALLPGQELVVHPVFLAAWFGLLVTMLNLLPVGQLDGGHVTHALFGVRARRLGHVFAALLVVLALVCSVSWLVWLFVVSKVVKFDHPPVLDEGVPLSRSRRVVCWVTLAFAVLCFMPVPIGLV